MQSFVPPKLTNASFVLVFKLLLQLSPFSTIAHQTPSVVAPFHAQPVHIPPCAPGSQQLSAPPVGRQTRPSHLLPTSCCFLDPMCTSPRWKKSSSSFLSSGSWEGVLRTGKSVVSGFCSPLMDSLSIQNSRLTVLFLPDCSAF